MGHTLIVLLFNIMYLKSNDYMILNLNKNITLSNYNVNLIIYIIFKITNYNFLFKTKKLAIASLSILNKATANYIP